MNVGAHTLTPNERRQQQFMRMQGFDDSAYLTHYQKQQLKAHNQAVQAIMKQIAEEKKKYKQAKAEMKAQKKGVDALPILHERNAALRENIKPLAEIQSGLRERVVVVREDLQESHQKRTELNSDINEMRDKLKSAEGKRFAVQSTIEQFGDYANGCHVSGIPSREVGGQKSHMEEGKLLCIQ